MVSDTKSDELRNNLLHAKLSKCDFFKPGLLLFGHVAGKDGLLFLGHVAAKDGLHVDPGKLQAAA